QVIIREMKRLKKRGKGSQTKFITLSMLTEISVFKPHDQTMHKFYENVNPMFKMKSNIEFENQKLSELRDWLLPMLMNGQVTVK
ncbi:MAG: hypothetical protein MK132_23295, partial [Lentisphaerales bacterium]|nr:hypothetical protein [Lentisphaerales bacterium]